MPTDLPPDYVPKRPTDPDSPKAPSPALPGESPDVVDPSGWTQPPTLPGDVPAGIPTPAGTPTF